MNWRKMGLYGAVAAVVVCLGFVSFVVSGSLSSRTSAAQPVVTVTSSSPSPTATSAPSTVAPIQTITASPTPPQQTNGDNGSDSFAMPAPNPSAAVNRPIKSVFGHRMPVPATWMNDTGVNNDGVRSFADMATCADPQLDNCPQIKFFDLANSTQSAHYGDNSSSPGRWLDSTPCADGSQKQAVQTTQGTIDGNAVTYSLQECGDDPYANNDNVVWYFAGLHLMVTGSEGVNGSLNLDVIQAVLEGMTP